MATTAYNPTSEVRFAVAMYGGVSLAIYINGVAQELFRLVRSTAPDNAERELEIADDDRDFKALDRVYREIGRRRAGEGEWISLEQPAPEIPSTRFVVDIITGTSAGGINGVLLAKALANGSRNIDALKRLWIEEGQIDDLLNEPDAYDTVDDFEYRSPPDSLLAGDRLLSRARTAIADLGSRTDSSAPHYADELDLTVTMTDLQGLWLPIQLSDREVWETHHRANLKFVYARPEATGAKRNDFNEMDRLLAFVARATSSFPAAFAPVRLRDGDPEVLVGESRIFGDWASVEADYGLFAFADGGYLQNKPIAHATAHLKRRRADRPVERKLLYLEPDPKAIPGDRTSAAPVPDAIENVGAAMGLPRQQPIRQDLEELRARNAAIARIASTKRALIPQVVGPEASPPFLIPGFYLALRRDEVARGMADVVERAYAVQPDGATARAIGMAFQGHAMTRDVEPYLRDFDLPFALRRLTYVLDEIDHLLNDAEDKTSPRNVWLRGLRIVVSNRHRAIRLAGRNARARETEAIASTAAHGFIRALGSWLTAAGNEVADETIAVSLYSEDISVQTWVETFASSIGDAVTELLLSDADTPIVAPSETPEDAELAQIATTLNRVFDRAVFIDSVIYPMSWPDLGESRHVSIHRVSPLEAESLVKMPVPGSDQPLRLAGVSHGHFGGFLDRAWRRNDMLWGRLDGAERLIAILVPEKQDRDELRVQAHAAILREEFGAFLADNEPDEEHYDLLSLIKPEQLERFRELLGGSNDAALVEQFRGAYYGPAEFDQARQLELGIAASGVAGKILAGNRRKRVKLLGRWVGRLRPLAGPALRIRERFRSL